MLSTTMETLLRNVGMQKPGCAVGVGLGSGNSYTARILQSGVGRRRKMSVLCLSSRVTSKTYTLHLEFRSYLCPIRRNVHFRF